MGQEFAVCINDAEIPKPFERSLYALPGLPFFCSSNSAISARSGCLRSPCKLGVLDHRADTTIRLVHVIGDFNAVYAGSRAAEAAQNNMTGAGCKCERRRL